MSRKIRHSESVLCLLSLGSRSTVFSIVFQMRSGPFTQNQDTGVSALIGSREALI